MGFGAGFAQAFGQGLQQLGQDRRQRENALELLAARSAAELEQRQAERAQARQDGINALTGVKIQKGTKKEKREIAAKDILDFKDATTGEVRPLNRSQAEGLLNQLETSITTNGYSMEPSAVKQRDILKGFIASSPQYEEVETPEYYTPEEAYGLKEAGIFDEVYKNQQALEDEKRRLKEIQSSGLPKEQQNALISAVLAGKGGASLGREFYINPYEQTKINYTERKTKDIDEDNTRADKGLTMKEAYQQKMLELRAQGLSQQEAHQKIMEEQGWGRIATAQQPTYSTTSYDNQGNATTVRQKGAPPKQVAPKQRPALPSFSATFK